MSMVYVRKAELLRSGLLLFLLKATAVIVNCKKKLRRLPCSLLAASPEVVFLVA